MSQLRNLMTENADLRHQLSNKDAQLASLGHLMKTVTTKLSQTPTPPTSKSGDTFPNPVSSMESLFQNTQKRQVAYLFVCQTRHI